MKKLIFFANYLFMPYSISLHLISGPAFWGLINPEWSLCNKGRRQSPVNLEPQRLLFDPNLRPLHIDKHRVSMRKLFSENKLKKILISLCFFFGFNFCLLDKRSNQQYWSQCHFHRWQRDGCEL